MRAGPTVYVVDDDTEVCQSLRWLIESAGFHVATYASAAEFLIGYDAESAGCLILDVRLSGQSGLDLQEQLVAERIGLPVIIITGFGDVPTAVRAMRNGAFDFIEKPFNNNHLLDRVRQAVELDIRNRTERAKRVDIIARLALLTPREREVLERVVNGWANRQIASDLGISTKTVEAHRAHLMEKMRAESLVGLIQLVRAVDVDKQPGLDCNTNWGAPTQLPHTD